MARRRHYYDPGSNPQPSRKLAEYTGADHQPRIAVLSRQLVRQMRRTIEGEDFRRACDRAHEMGWRIPTNRGGPPEHQQRWRGYWRACLDAELRGDGGRPTPPSQPAPLPGAEEQWERYEAQLSEYFAAREAWIAGGRVGDPPPHPVRPHTPGAHP